MELIQAYFLSARRALTAKWQRYALTLFLTPWVFILSLLSVSAILLLLPVVFTDETILARSTSRFRGWLRGWDRRAVALIAGLTTQFVLLFFAIQLSIFLPVSAGMRWVTVLLVVYAIDIAVLLAIGKIPLQYNVRNLLVRWKIT